MKLLWTNETADGQSAYYILKRQTPTLRPFLPKHTHDYAELVYLERGTCVHELNGKSTRVGKGDILFLQPDVTEHCYQDIDEHLSMLQILFQKDSYSFITERYQSTVGSLFNDSSRNPLFHFDPVQQIWFERNYNQLLITEGLLIEIERFLLNIIGLITESDTEETRGAAESWLDRAFKEIQEPGNFRRGVQGFVEICARSAEHVDREVKKRTGHTITDVVNQARMSWASYMLVYSDAEIFDIALGCGFDSLSYFYKLFKKYFSMSPAKYRIAVGISSSLQDRNILHPYKSDYLF
jgi:AraC family cel operon transcriptional repressor